MLTCPNCGSATAETNKFCQNCGAALTPQTSPAAVSASGAPTPIRQSGTGRRTTLLAVIGGGVGALIVVGLVLYSFRPQPPHCCPPPVTSPSPGSTPGTGSDQTIETERIAVVVSSGWQVVATKPDAIQIKNPHGLLSFGASSLAQPQTPTELIQGDLTEAQKVDPNAKLCGGPLARSIPNGPDGGQVVAICLVYPTQGQSSQAIELSWHGVNADASIDFAVNLLVGPAYESVFTTEALAVIRTVRWKQYLRPAPPGLASAPPASSNQSVVLQGSGTQDTRLLTTDDSLYRVTWQATNLIPDVTFPDLPCMFEIVYFKGGGSGAITGGGAFGATTLLTDSETPVPERSGSTTFRPHPGQGYLEVNACDRAQYVVTLEKAT
jgi:hypothetical protein